MTLLQWIASARLSNFQHPIQLQQLFILPLLREGWDVDALSKLLIYVTGMDRFESHLSRFGLNLAAALRQHRTLLSTP